MTNKTEAWTWQHQHGAPVLVSPSGVVRRVQKYVKPTRAGDDPWVQDTSDAAIFTDAMNQWEGRKLNEAFADEPSARPFHLWESPNFSFNMADVILIFEEGDCLGIELRNRGSHVCRLYKKDLKEEFIKHWRQYQQWRHINGK